MQVGWSGWGMYGRNGILACKRSVVDLHSTTRKRPTRRSFRTQTKHSPRICPHALGIDLFTHVHRARLLPSLRWLHSRLWAEGNFAHVAALCSTPTTYDALSFELKPMSYTYDMHTCRVVAREQRCPAHVPLLLRRRKRNDNKFAMLQRAKPCERRSLKR